MKSQLHLIDLAGSERLSQTVASTSWRDLVAFVLLDVCEQGAVGQQMKEGAQINKSLLALGNVINALVCIVWDMRVFFVWLSLSIVCYTCRWNVVTCPIEIPS